MFVPYASVDMHVNTDESTFDLRLHAFIYFIYLLFLLMFEYSCFHFPTTTFLHPTHAHLISVPSGNAGSLNISNLDF